jgi:peptidoglycan hydrolase CwlO-like protein
LTDAYHRLNQNKDKYKNDLEVCTNYLLEVEEKCQEAQKTSLELLQQLKERELEIEHLQDVIHQL